MLPLGPHPYDLFALAPGLPVSPQHCGFFALAPMLPSFWPATLLLWTGYKQVENYKTRQVLLIHQLVLVC
jgi:hypothetical protein